jgi:hypothetical protein
VLSLDVIKNQDNLYNSQPVILLNSRINSEHRYERLIALLSWIGKDYKAVIRVRGIAKYKSRLEPFESYSNIKFFYENSFQDWKLDLMQQVLVFRSSTYLLLQEDHLPVVGRKKLREVVNEAVSANLDYLPLSFFPQHSNFINHLNLEKAKLSYSENLDMWTLDKSTIRKMNDTTSYVYISLVGFFSKKLLIRILKSYRPFYKTYSVTSPFDFEQNSSQTWFLPIRFGFPKSELFANIDDDHSVQDYSLISRGLYKEDIVRQVQHHDIDPNKNSMSKFLPLLKYIALRYCPNYLIVLPRNFRYTLFFYKNINIRRKSLRFMMKNTQDSKYI